MQWRRAALSGGAGESKPAAARVRLAPIPKASLVGLRGFAFYCASNGLRVGLAQA